MNFEIRSIFEFQNVIKDSAITPKRHYDARRTKIDMWVNSNTR